MISISKIEGKLIKEDIKQDIKFNDLEKSEKQTYYYSDYARKYSLKEVTSIMLEKWPTDNKFFYEKYDKRKFEKRIFNVLEKFINPEELTSFKEKVNEK